MSPNAFYFLGKSSSWETEALAIFADSRGSSRGDSFVSTQYLLPRSTSLEGPLVNAKPCSGMAPASNTTTKVLIEHYLCSQQALKLSDLVPVTREPPFDFYILFKSQLPLCVCFS